MRVTIGKKVRTVINEPDKEDPNGFYMVSDTPYGEEGARHVSGAGGSDRGLVIMAVRH